MIGGIILYIVVFCAEPSNGLLVYTNDCGTLTVSQPAIDGKRVLLTFVPHGTVDDEIEVEWKYKGHYTWKISNSSVSILSSRQKTYTVDLYCEKSNWGQYSAKLITPADECSSEWVSLDIRNAPTGCGILYKGPDRIKPNDEVVLKYYPTKSVLSRDEYIRQLRLKTDDCVGQFGCPVNETWYEEEYTDYNSVYLYRIRNFSFNMEGNYLIQCTNWSRDNIVTNDVRLIVSVPPSSPTFLNTVDVENCTSCIPVKSGRNAEIQCQVIGGTLPVTVKIAIAGKDEVHCDFDEHINKICYASKYVNNNFHLKGIRCKAENEALDQPLTTFTKLYVVENPIGPTLYSPPQTEGKVNIYCKSWYGRPAPNLSLLIDGNLINTTIVHTEDLDKHIKLTYLKRDWNGAKIECCMKHLYYAEQKCSVKRNVDYLFSPASVTLTASKPKPSDTGSFRQTLRCTIINANPACRVKWNHPDGAKITPENITRPVGQGGYTTVSELLLNGSMEIDGSEIDCQPNCDKFETKDIATHTIHILYPPTLSINTSGQNSWKVGDTVVFACSVDSYSPVNVTWYTSQNQSLDSLYCGEGAVCLKLDRIQEEDAGTYVCKAATEYFDTAVESVVLNIESTATDKLISERREKTLPWKYIGIGAAAGVVILLLVTVLVIKTRRNTDRRKTAHEDIPMNAPNDQAIVNEPRDEQNGADAYDSINEATYANTDNRGQKGGKNVKTAGPSSLKAEANTYEPVPIPEEQHMDSRDTESNSAGQPGTSDLVYADLDLPTDRATSGNPKIASAEPQTEYVSIDFNKVGEQLPEPSDIESENIYANQ